MKVYVVYEDTEYAEKVFLVKSNAERYIQKKEIQGNYAYMAEMVVSDVEQPEPLDDTHHYMALFTVNQSFDKAQKGEYDTAQFYVQKNEGVIGEREAEAYCSLEFPRMQDVQHAKLLLRIPLGESKKEAEKIRQLIFPKMEEWVMRIYEETKGRQLVYATERQKIRNKVFPLISSFLKELGLD